MGYVCSIEPPHSVQVPLKPSDEAAAASSNLCRLSDAIGTARMNIVMAPPSFLHHHFSLGKHTRVLPTARRDNRRSCHFLPQVLSVPPVPEIKPLYPSQLLTDRTKSRRAHTTRYFQSPNHHIDIHFQCYHQHPTNGAAHKFLPSAPPINHSFRLRTLASLPKTKIGLLHTQSNKPTTTVLLAHRHQLRPSQPAIRQPTLARSQNPATNHRVLLVASQSPCPRANQKWRKHDDLRPVRQAR